MSEKISERIWVTPGIVGGAYTTKDGCKLPYDVEFVRADLFAALTAERDKWRGIADHFEKTSHGHEDIVEADARKTALEEAAKICENRSNLLYTSANTLEYDSPLNSIERHCANVCSHDAAEIRALIDKP